MARIWRWKDIWSGVEYKVTFPGTNSLLWDTVEVLTSSQLWNCSYWGTVPK